MHLLNHHETASLHYGGIPGSMPHSPDSASRPRRKRLVIHFVPAPDAHPKHIEEVEETKEVVTAMVTNEKGERELMAYWRFGRQETFVSRDLFPFEAPEEMGLADQRAFFGELNVRHVVPSEVGLSDGERRTQATQNPEAVTNALVEAGIPATLREVVLNDIQLSREYDAEEIETRTLNLLPGFLADGMVQGVEGSDEIRAVKSDGGETLRSKMKEVGKNYTETSYRAHLIGKYFLTDESGKASVYTVFAVEKCWNFAFVKDEIEIVPEGNSVETESSSTIIN